VAVNPFNAQEVQGYLRHSIREAGGDVDKVLDAGAIDMLYRCSEGIPRVINNLHQFTAATSRIATGTRSFRAARYRFHAAAKATRLDDATGGR
jgi:type II secretory pathway predicted ATPase ExeA